MCTNKGALHNLIRVIRYEVTLLARSHPYRVAYFYRSGCPEGYRTSGVAAAPRGSPTIRTTGSFRLFRGGSDGSLVRREDVPHLLGR